MSKPGPKKKPHKLKVLNGVENKARLNPNEPVVDKKMPIAPEWLKGYGMAIWARLVPKLHESGILTFVDRDLFAAYCQLMGEFRESVRADNVGRQVKLVQQLRIMAAEFGLTPSSRAGLHVPGGARKSKENSKKAARLLG